MVKILNKRFLFIASSGVFCFLLFVLLFYHTNRTYFDLNSGRRKKVCSFMGLPFSIYSSETKFSKFLKNECQLEKKDPHWKFVSGRIQDPIQKYYECTQYGYQINGLTLLAELLEESELPHKERVNMAVSVITELQNENDEKAEIMIDQFTKELLVYQVTNTENP